MTRHSQAPNAGFEESIVEHFEMLASLPECESTVLKDAASSLALTWRQEAQSIHILGGMPTFQNAPQSTLQTQH